MSIKRMNTIRCFFYYVFILYTSSIHCQIATDAKIQNVNFELVNNKLVITYDIVNFDRGETFFVTIKIFNTLGEEVIPVTIEGDVNKSIKGGIGKMIIWDIVTDKPGFNDDIFVEVYAVKDLKLGKTMMQSIVYPGLGNYKITHNKAYLSSGVLAYGLVATSFIFEQKAITTYRKYEDNYDFNSRNDLYDKAMNQREISNICMYIGATIWVIDLGVTLINTRKYKGIDSTIKRSNVSVRYYFDPNLHNAPLLSIQYNL